MTRACHAPIRAATGDAFTDAEIDDILDRLARKHKRAKGKAPTASDEQAWQQAAADLTREEVETALQARRLEHFAKAARVARETRMAAMTAGGLDEAQALKAYNVGSDKQAGFSSASVDAEGRARAVAAWGDVERGLAAHEGLSDRLVNFWGGGDDAFDRDVAREMARLNGADIEATGDADALAAARVFAAALEKNRQGLNAQGAFVGKLKGRIAAQSHDRLKVSGGFWREFREAGIGAPARWGEARLQASRKAFRQWRDYIRPRLDPATFDGIDAADGALADEAEALAKAGVIDDAADLEERFLYRAWWNIVSGAHEVLGGAQDLAEFRPPAGKARAVSKHRVLHFRDPDAWMDYHAEYGRGSLYGVVMGELERGGKNAALMARWGPSPEAAFGRTMETLGSAARARGDAGAANALQSRLRQAEFDELTGETNRPDNLRLALIGRTIRTSQVLSKLGGMVLSALSDTALASQAMTRAGGNFAGGYGAALKGIARLQDAEGKRAADLLDVGSRSAAAHLMGRFTATDGPLGWSAWAQRVFYRVNGFEAWSDGLRRGVGEMLSAHWGAEAQFEWAGLQAGTRETFERYGIDRGLWDLARTGTTPLEDGRTYFSLEAIDGLSDAQVHGWAGLKGKQATAAAAARLRDDIKLRFQTMTGGILDDALTEARARERVALVQGLKAGTVWGEAVRSFTQFWSFSAAILGRHVAPAARGFAGRQPVALLAHLIVATTLLGAASLQAKQLVKGRTPRPLDRPETWLAALLQGGGMGIYGDFLFGEYARSGMPATISSFAGPSVSELERLRLVVGAAAGTLNPLTTDEKRDASKQVLEQQGFRFIKDNTPFANIFYTRLALDYLVLWRLQEAISPGYLARYEANVREREGSDFLISPTDAVQ
jgi:hypothetical protein